MLLAGNEGEGCSIQDTEGTHVARHGMAIFEVCQTVLPKVTVAASAMHEGSDGPG